MITQFSSNKLMSKVTLLLGELGKSWSKHLRHPARHWRSLQQVGSWGIPTIAPEVPVRSPKC